MTLTRFMLHTPAGNCAARACEKKERKRPRPIVPEGRADDRSRRRECRAPRASSGSCGGVAERAVGGARDLGANVCVVTAPYLLPHQPVSLSSLLKVFGRRPPSNVLEAIDSASTSKK